MAVVYNMYQNSLQINSFHFLQISITLYRFLNSQHVALVVAPLLPALHTLILMLQEESTVSFVKVCRKYQIYIIFLGQQLARVYVQFEMYINVEIVGCYNRRHRRGANSTLGSGQGLKSKSRRGSQDSDDVDDDSLAAELLVSTVKNLRSLCEIMLDGIRYRIT